MNKKILKISFIIFIVILIFILVIIQRLMNIYAKDKNNLIIKIKTYNISLGKNPKGHKIKEGDSKTPEGKYFIDSKNSKSGYYINLGISYLNKNDSLNARNLGVLPGGDIKFTELQIN